jgi:hypothetical protein
MPWKTINGRSYYYKQRKVSGKVRSQYIGAGPVAELLAQRDGASSAQREAERQDLRNLKAEQNALDKQIDELGAAVRQYVDAVLLVSGYRLHKRSEWRRTRGGHDNRAGE